MGLVWDWLVVYRLLVAERRPRAVAEATKCQTIVIEMTKKQRASEKHQQKESMVGFRKKYPFILCFYGKDERVEDYYAALINRGLC